MSSAVDKAYRTIRSQIFGGLYKAGDRLKEEELAEQIGVSRTPIREALRRLNAEHIVEFAPNHGACVANWSSDDIDEIYALRGLLECHVARRAAERISVEEIASLDTIQDEIEAAAASGTKEDLDRVAELNHRFHNILLRAARSDRVAMILSWLIDIPVMLRTYHAYSPRDMARSLNHHRELIEALKSRNVVWAEAVMAAHVNAARMVLANRPHDEVETVEAPLEPPRRRAAG